mgnify:CR=1 FL=1
MSVAKICIYKQILVGNFDDNEAAAKKYSSIMTDRMTEHCREYYPDAELDIDFDFKLEFGYAHPVFVHVECVCENDSEAYSESIKVKDDIEAEYVKANQVLERSGEIYE